MGWRRSPLWRRAAVLIAVLGPLLATLGALQHTGLRDSLIATEVASFRADLAAGLADFQRIPRLRSQAARPQLCGPGGPAAVGAARQLAATVSAVAGRAVTVVVYDRSLLPVLSSDVPPPGVPAVAPPQLEPAALRRALRGEEAAPEIIDAGAGSQLVAGFPIRFAGVPACGVAQLSASMKPIDDVLTAERSLLLRVYSLLLVIALGALLWGSRRARGGPHPWAVSARLRLRGRRGIARRSG